MALAAIFDSLHEGGFTAFWAFEPIGGMYDHRFSSFLVQTGLPHTIGGPFRKYVFLLKEDVWRLALKASAKRLK